MEIFGYFDLAVQTRQGSVRMIEAILTFLKHGTQVGFVLSAFCILGASVRKLVICEIVDL